MLGYLLSKLIILVYGVLYPAYQSFKAVKTKDVKEYVHWMLYWIVFAIFSLVEIFTDILIGFWFPFYYELKIVFLFWLLSPTTRGASVLYRRYIHSTLALHEAEIDAFLEDFKSRMSVLIIHWGSKAFNWFTEVVMKSKAFREMCEIGYSKTKSIAPDTQLSTHPAATTTVTEAIQESMEFDNYFDEHLEYSDIETFDDNNN